MGLIRAGESGTIVNVEGALPDGVLGEVRTHQQIYKRRTDVRAIARTFPPNVVALSTLGFTPKPRHRFGAYFTPEKVPSLPLRLAELFVEAGLPAGVCNVLNCDAETVRALIDHPDVAAVSFVGSTPIAEFVSQRGMAAGKRVQALGGAKNHLVVMPDAHMDLPKLTVPTLEIAPVPTTPVPTTPAPYEGPQAATASMVERQAGYKQFYASLFPGAPNVTIVTIPNSKHFVMVDQPKALFDAITAFVATLPAT